MPGRFKLDENLPRDAKALLLAAGHDAETATDEHLGGNPDLKVLDAVVPKAEYSLRWISISPTFGSIRRLLIQAFGSCVQPLRASRTRCRFSRVRLLSSRQRRPHAVFGSWSPVGFESESDGGFVPNQRFETDAPSSVN